jgi:hypothetical protein
MGLKPCFSLLRKGCWQSINATQTALSRTLETAPPVNYTKWQLSGFHRVPTQGIVGLKTESDGVGVSLRVTLHWTFFAKSIKFYARLIEWSYHLMLDCGNIRDISKSAYPNPHIRGYRCNLISKYPQWYDMDSRRYLQCRFRYSVDR